MIATRLAGVGVGLRREIADELLATHRHLDWVEIIAENFMDLGGRARERLLRARERWPVVPHGVALSLGSVEPANYSTKLKSLADTIEAPLVSDHLCYSSLGGHEYLDLLPMPFTEEAAVHVAARARQHSATVGRTFLVENVTTYAVMPGSDMSEAAFIRRVLALSGDAVGLLLDVNNLYLDAMNHGLDPEELLASMPLDRVGQIHVAGHVAGDGVLLDTHSRPVAEPVWALLGAALRAIGPVPVLVEWDQHIPSVDALLDEADRARRILDACA